MRIDCRRFAIAAGLLAAGCLAVPASAADYATVVVSDLDLPGGHMAMRLSTTTVRAGKVKFVSGNGSDKGRDHEVLMIKTDLDPKDLPSTIDGMAIDEHMLKGLQELGDLKAGESKTATAVLSPGMYLLFCNKPGHTGSGMFAKLKVTETVGAQAPAEGPEPRNLAD